MKKLLGIVLLAAACALPARAASTQGSILFAADRAPALSGEVYRLGLDGKLVDLSRSPYPDTRPLVSPDGAWVAFVRERGSSSTVWVVHPDGSGRRQISSALPAQNGGVETAWSPDGRLLAVIVATGFHTTLYVVGPGVRRRTITHGDSMVEPGWSPDGRLVTVRTSHGVDAFTIGGARAWQVLSSGVPAGWSAKGLFAASLAGWATVYDERGHTLAKFRGGEGAWSADGLRLAVHAATRLDVHATDGRLVFTKKVPGLVPNGSNGVRWDGSSAVFVGGLAGERVVRVDVRSGKIAAATTEAFAMRSRDGRILKTVPAGTSFAFRVGSRTVGRVPGCNDDSSGPAAAVSSLQLTPDGRSLVYQSYCAEPFANLWTVAPDGTQLRRVTHVSAQETAPGWSPDGARIAYTRAEAVGLSCKGCPARVWVADAGGGNAKALTTADPDSSWDNDPSWSPDGTSVLYAHATVSSFGELHVVKAAGGPSRDLHVAGNYATWGPSRIAFVDSGANPAVLWTMAPDGTDKRRIASGLLYAPAWSRSGVLACLERKQMGAPALLEFAAQGTSRVILPFADVRDLAWSPDGTRFAFAALAKNGATFDVYTLRTDGTGLERLTRNVDAFNVSWR